MRTDFSKILVERPRWGHGAAGVRLRDRLGPRVSVVPAEDESAVRSRDRSWKTKQLSENLAPLERYLRSNVGRPWSKVYSEIRRGVDTRKAISLHILQHLYQYLHTECWFEDGVLMTHSHAGPQKVEWGFYVHPANGILREVVRRTTAKDRRNFNHLVLDGRQMRKIRGIWYEMLDLPPGKRQLNHKTVREIEYQIERARKGKTQPKGWAFGISASW